MPGKQALDLAQLDTVAVKFYLLIKTTEKFETAIRLKTCPVTGSIQSRAGCRGERIGNKPRGGQVRSIQISARESVAANVKLASNADRMRNLAQLTPILADELRRRPSAAWIERFEAAGVPVGPVHQIGDMLSDPQVAARDMVIEVDHPRAGRTRAIGAPIKFSETSGDLTRPAPLFGQHSREILEQLGYTAAEIAALSRDGAVHLGDAAPA